ncbi:MAG: TetR/AcrR family transcriptional regulator [Clostridia bacterium]|nr:TetR/AcrR family transcriptional regulator [Clostridia bacterium]
MKTDARVIYTNNVLKNALLTYLEQKPLCKISVSEICTMAGVNRSTFYKHYDGCNELYEKIEKEQLEEFKNSLINCNLNASLDVTYTIFNVKENQPALCKLLAIESTHDAILNKIMKITYEHCLPAWKKHTANATENECKVLLSFLIRGVR